MAVFAQCHKRGLVRRKRWRVDPCLESSRQWRERCVGPLSCAGRGVGTGTGIGIDSVMRFAGSRVCEQAPVVEQGLYHRTASQRNGGRSSVRAAIIVVLVVIGAHLIASSGQRLKMTRRRQYCPLWRLGIPRGFGVVPATVAGVSVAVVIGPQRCRERLKEGFCDAAVELHYCCVVIRNGSICSVQFSS